MPKLIRSHIPGNIPAPETEKSSTFDFSGTIDLALKYAENSYGRKKFNKIAGNFFDSKNYENNQKLFRKLYEKFESQMECDFMLSDDSYGNLKRKTSFQHRGHDYCFEYGYDYNREKLEFTSSFYLRDCSAPAEIVNGISFVDLPLQRRFTGGYGSDNRFPFDSFMVLALFLDKLSKYESEIRF